ncbi:AAA family ATPase [Dyadobacter aurulentus]|uniref:AAA family ATPase n=1 Tax=Dyadobacter sp. UC 10 TaxID=2605428 RepID=UPI0011F1F9DA|nr:AAA family ATPase [Dyadobacter sp. UC 10]KAA0993328.1 AAA family ATPase [Dyadobacter sp. UC 10]
MNKIIISGGPGAGKSSLLGGLEKAGFCCIPEVSRKLIRGQVEAGTNMVPWVDLAGFARLCLEEMVRDFEYAGNNGLTFFDRGIPDIIAYLRFGGLDVDHAYLIAAKKYRYACNVFVAPSWEAIYVNDAERWQTFAEANALYFEIKKMYTTLGYHVIELPFASVGERVEFTLTKLEQLEVK